MSVDAAQPGEPSSGPPSAAHRPNLQASPRTVPPAGTGTNDHAQAPAQPRARVSILAGGLAGMAVDFVFFPLDTLKTRLQARVASAAPRITGAAFYKGLASAMAGSFPGAATFWLAYEQSSAALARTAWGQTGAGQVFTPAVAAAAANVAVCAVRNPFEVVKQQMQSGMHKTSRAAVQQIIARDGLAGLWAGYRSTVLREIPFDALQFMLYEPLKRSVAAGQPGEDLALWQNAACGSAAGCVAGAVTTPLDTVKTRLMTQAGTGGPPKYLGVTHALRTIYAEEGWAALFAGLKPRVTWITLGGAVFFGSFEELKRRLS